MAHVLIMPRQGNTVESCIIVRWSAREGDSVSADRSVCEVETDKASFDVPAGSGGILLKILRAEGDDVPVLEPIAVIGAAGEDWRAALGSAAQAPGGATTAPEGGAAAAAAAAPAAADSGTAVAGAAAPNAGDARATTGPEAPKESPGVSPRARRLAAQTAVDASALQGSGPGGRVLERDVAAAAAPLTAAARASAAATGAPLPSGGSALGGRIGVADLGAAKPASTPVKATAAGSPASPEIGPYSDTPLKGIRKIIADRMRASLAQSAQLSFDVSADAERISAVRARFKASDKALGLSEVTIGDLVLFAVSRVLPAFPMVNAHLVDGTLRTFERVHLGLAVDTPRGLMVPVIRNADRLSLAGISAEAKRLAAACLGGSISPDELSGSTFTVSNLGAFGIESFTPVLNAPEVGVLGVCAITKTFVPGPDGAPSLRSRMGLSLTVDHQVVDGAPAARIIKAIADAIGDIDLYLMK
ncbi:MAG TPA: dihydrolipoamide acetyltransferase family protein [Rectinemataceae bacterium]|nr:dihydrolipoamide acetyltransferase family protein [Rectinemataceae bacterium]